MFLNDLRGDDGAQASFRWFCPFRSSEKVYVASEFGLLLGILRLKSWSNNQFMKSDYIRCLISGLNTRGFESNVGDPSENIVSLQSQAGVVEAMQPSQQGNNKGFETSVDLPTPPSTPIQIPPKREQAQSRRSYQEIKQSSRKTPARNRNTNGDKNENELAVVLKTKIREIDTLLEQMRTQAKNEKSESCPVVLSDPLEIRDEVKRNTTENKAVQSRKRYERSKRKSAFKTTLSHASNI